MDTPISPRTAKLVGKITPDSFVSSFSLRMAQQHTPKRLRQDVLGVLHAIPKKKLKRMPMFGVGDVLLIVGEEQDQVYASRKVLRESSPVWHAMFKSCFRESEASEIHLPEDDAGAITVIMSIIHKEMLPEMLGLEDLCALAITCDKYDCARVVHNHSDHWISNQKWIDVVELFEEWLYVAEIFRFKPVRWLKIHHNIVDWVDLSSRWATVERYGYILKELAYLFTKDHDTDSSIEVVLLRPVDDPIRQAVDGIIRVRSHVITQLFCLIKDAITQISLGPTCRSSFVIGADIRQCIRGPLYYIRTVMIQFEFLIESPVSLDRMSFKHWPPPTTQKMSLVQILDTILGKSWPGGSWAESSERREFTPRGTHSNCTFIEDAIRRPARKIVDEMESPLTAEMILKMQQEIDGEGKELQPQLA